MDDEVYVAGDSKSVDFPGLPKNTEKTREEGTRDIVFLRLDHELKKIDNANFLGGRLNERAPAILMGPGNLKVIAGLTYSEGFPEGAQLIEEHIDSKYYLFVKQLSFDPTEALPPVLQD